MHSHSRDYWRAMQALVVEAQIVIDRPRGQPHPRYPELIYPFDYGYIEGTTAADGAGIDIWLGSQSERTLSGLVCTFDRNKRDAEIKLLVGCSVQDVEIILQFQRSLTHCLYIPRGDT